MKRILVTCFLTYCGVNVFAQEIGNECPYSATFVNGASACVSYNKKENMLNVSIRNNDDEVEIIAVKRGMVVESESTFFMNDEMQLDLSNNVTGKYDIYVKARNEIQHIGSIETEIKEESK